ncbi:MAG: hypothetical protein HOB40_04165 [Candidatus Marinimicrobia bacterium]|jgi:hypothetical protein|nr:hypothetical protein [Candidatus Neomarinimicrobiota bacterium]MBT7556818.1 hypothetical protein [Candidatus Woesearchaeota archaeon]MBT3839903.1 hypothetical protein [Candidatus Neomarinimicrobiota bacterium]MBT3998483.1 hypothetical protein [Candidatus Neomarinimicrobiota bacterium]MBT4957569.1 hypothetical protein [Candidatus Neomarinimicrobiota bacterium]
MNIRKNRMLKFYKYLSLILVLLVGIIYAQDIEIENIDSDDCISCHEVENHELLILESIHEDNECLDCHIDRDYTPHDILIVDSPVDGCYDCHDTFNDIKIAHYDFLSSETITLTKTNCTTCHQDIYHNENPVDIHSLFQIDKMMSLYLPVEFDHGNHMDISGNNCSTCHHNAFTETQNEDCKMCHKGEVSNTNLSCDNCHNKILDGKIIKANTKQFNYHIDIPLLKSVYHLNCIGCHEDNDVPTGCQDCHKKSDKGNRRFYSGDNKPMLNTNNKH